jgi:hypothetical protein
LKTPYEEYADWPKRGLTVVDHGNRITATDPVLGEMYSSPKDLIDRRTNEVVIHRAVIEFAEANAKAFAEWFFTGSEDE